MPNQTAQPYRADWAIRRRLAAWLAPTERRGVFDFLFCYPLVAPACAFIGGIVAADYLPLPSALAASVFLFVLSAALFARGWRQYRQTAQRGAGLCWAAAMLAMLCAGAMRYAAFKTPPPNDISRRLIAPDTLAALEGDIISDIAIDQPDAWAFGKYFPGGQTSHFYLKLSGIQTEQGLEPTRGVVRVQVGDEVKHLRFGDRARVYAVLNLFQPPSNPGQFDLKASMARRGVAVAAFAPLADSVQRLGDAPRSIFQRARYALRRRALALLADQADWPDDTQSLAAALLLGWRGQLDGATYAAFVRTGLAHFISLSGMHIGILAGTLWLASRYCGLDKRWRAALCIVLIALYGLLIPPRPPALRAMILAFFYFGGIVIRRRTEPLNTLALCALVLLAIRPADVFTPSFQLSFACVAGILIFFRPFYDALSLRVLVPLTDRLPARQISRWWTQWIFSFLDMVLAALSVGFAAWVGGAGVLAYHFYAITPLSAVFTVLALPLVTAILYAGYAKLVLTAVFPTAAVAAAAVLDAAGRLFLRLVEHFADWPAAYIPVGAVPLAWVAVGCAVVLIWRLAASARVKRAAALTALALLAAAVWATYDQRRGLTMAVADVGHGQAIWLRFDDGTNWLVDAGSITVKNVGAKIIAPMLRYYGVGRLDAAMLTHGDMDHLNGFPEIADTMPIGVLAAPPPVLTKTQKPSSVSFLLQRLSRQGIAAKEVSELPLPRSARIAWLWPTADALDQNYSDNDLSLAFRIEYAGRSILLCGDIEQAAQNELLARHPDLKADVLVLPHHGAKNTLNEAFVDRIKPQVIVASHRRGSVYTPAGGDTAFFSTAADGAIEINIKADGVMRAVGFASDKRFMSRRR